MAQIQSERRKRKIEQIFSDISAIIFLVFAIFHYLWAREVWDARNIYPPIKSDEISLKQWKHLLVWTWTCSSVRHSVATLGKTERKATRSGDRIPYKLTQRSENQRKEMKSLSICMIITFLWCGCLLIPAIVILCGFESHLGWETFFNSIQRVVL